MPDRTPIAPLFDAALEATATVYGTRIEPRTVTIVTGTGLEVSFQVPPGWSPSETTSAIRGVECFAEVLATIVQAGRRLTRAALLEEMQRHDRKRAESTVCLALDELMRLRIIDNRQDTNPKGYGIRGSD